MGFAPSLRILDLDLDLEGWRTSAGLLKQTPPLMGPLHFWYILHLSAAILSLPPLPLLLLVLLVLVLMLPSPRITPLRLQMDIHIHLHYHLNLPTGRCIRAAARTSRGRGNRSGRSASKSGRRRRTVNVPSYPNP